MADRYTEARLENWARANRECHHATKGATQVFCESLRYLYGMPETEDGQPVVEPKTTGCRTTDLDDANRIDEAYRSPLLPMIYKNLLRMYYVNRVHPRSIEKRLSLVRKTFYQCKERAITSLMSIVIDNEERGQKHKMCDKITSSVGYVTGSKE